MSAVIPHVDLPVEALTLFGAGVPLAILLVYRSIKQGQRARVMREFLVPYRRGDYVEALAIIERLRNDPASYLYHRGALLAQLGHLDDAEPLLRQSIALREKVLRPNPGSRETKLLAITWSTLGELLRSRGDFSEAKQCFQSSLRIWPGRGETHRELAEAWLHEGTDVGEGLKWARLAVEEDRSTPHLTGELYLTKLGEDLSVLAWAVALNTPADSGGVDQLVSEAVSKVGISSVPSTARVLYYSGLAYRALGDRDRYTKFLTDAAQVDMHGRWGRAARQAAAT